MGQFALQMLHDGEEPGGWHSGIALPGEQRCESCGHVKDLLATDGFQLELEGWSGDQVLVVPPFWFVSAELAEALSAATEAQVRWLKVEVRPSSAAAAAVGSLSRAVPDLRLLWPTRTLRVAPKKPERYGECPSCGALTGPDDYEVVAVIPAAGILLPERPPAGDVFRVKNCHSDGPLVTERALEVIRRFPCQQLATCEIPTSE